MPTVLSISSEQLPELPVSPYPNFVTARGMAQLRARLADAELRLSELPADAELESSYLHRHIRWLETRLRDAVTVALQLGAAEVVGFGATVEVRDPDGSCLRYRIVGEDEADLERGLVSWVSPLARALDGARIGNEVHWRSPDGEIHLQVTSIDFKEPTPPH